MRKKLTAILMALTIAISLLPMPAMAANADDEAQIKAIVSKVITDYAKKVYRANADDDAFDLFFKHGFYGNGKDMILTESSPMVSALFNTCLLQEALINGISAAITAMDIYRTDSMYISGDIGWHNYYYNYTMIGYQSTVKDSGYRLATVASTKSLYGEGHYPGPRNENDEVMELLVGALYPDILITRGELRNGMAEYTISFHFHDDFDFTSDYSSIAEKGYDTSTDSDLKNLGFLMTFMGLDEFYWEYKTTMKLTLPYSCEHGLKSFHWTYHGDTATVSSESGNGFAQNDTTKLEYISVDSSTGTETTKYYHQLEESVILRHDQPWVVEWEQTGMRTYQFSPTGSSGLIPTLYAYSRFYVWFVYTEYVTLPEGQTTESGSPYYSVMNYVGVELQDRFEYKSMYTYTHTLENKINPDGSNTIYLTIYNHDLDEIVLGPEPMDTHWTKRVYDIERTLISTESTALSGKDIIFGYLGSKSISLSDPKIDLDLRIYEGGKDYTEPQAIHTAPTCTEAGGMKHHCLDCGGDYLTDIEPALGHTYTDYTDDGNATCTADGTKTRKCTVCGETETVTVTGSALGHDFTDYTDDGNSSCTDVGTKTRTCTICGVAETIPNEGTADGHDFGTYLFDHNASCTDDGTKTAVCKVCGEKDTVPAEGSATGHRYEAAVTEATCTAEGYTTYTCHCGDSYVSDRTPVAPHTEVIDQAVASTCVQQGLTEGKHCAVCGKVTVPQMSAPLGSHTWDAGKVIQAPTATTPGTLMYTCEVCGKTNHMSITELPSTGFEDVPADAYYAAAVAWAKENGITSGITETLFGSDMGCTRGQVVTFLWAAAGRPEATATENPFTDVTETDYYYKPVLWAAEQDITGGIAEGLFGPNETCTRGQIVTFLWRAMGSPATGTTPDFTDVTASDWFAQPVAWAAENEVTGGIGNGMFGPNNTCTRAQVVTFLFKVYS